MVLPECAGQRLAAFIFICGCQHAEVGDAAQVGDVVGPGMGGTVGADESGTVKRKHHRQVLQRHVVDQLVVTALQEGGVNRQHRLETFAGQAGGKSDGVLLCDADVEVALGVALLKLDQAGALTHRRGDGHQALVSRCHVAQPVTKDLGETEFGRSRRFLQADGRVELARPVVVDRVGFGQLVTVAFLRDDVQELRARPVTQIFQGRDQCIQVVAIDRADIGEAELFEDGARHDHALGVLFESARQFVQRCVLQHALRAFASRGVEVTADQSRQVLVQRTHWRADRHVVVVEDHQQVGQAHTVGRPAVIEGLEGHAAGQSPVADHRHRAAALALEFGRMGHAQGRGDRCRRVTGTECVVLAFDAARKTADAAQLLERGHRLAPAGEDLVRVGLVAHVPDDAVVRGVEHIVQRNRQLDRAQVGRQVAAGLAHRAQHEAAQFVGQALEFAARQATQVGW